MDTDIRALTAIAKTYFDAAYEMDAEKFASIFHRSCAVTRVGEDGNVSVTPLEAWLEGVRTMKAPKLQGLERHDEILSIDVAREIALLKLKLQIPPRYFTDMLSCLKINGTWKIVQKVMNVERVDSLRTSQRMANSLALGATCALSATLPPKEAARRPES